MRIHNLIAALVTATIFSAACSEPRESAPPRAEAPAPAARAPASYLLEGFPPQRELQMREYQQALTSTVASNPHFDTVVRLSRRWANGNTVRVAFRGGSPTLHRGIEQMAALWSQHANIGFDFGWDSVTKRYRTWSPGDVQPTAEIRIGFDEDGYWSCVGTDSMLDQCAAASQPSMNFAAFDRRLPQGWASIVLHEFGHAIGLEHEHQNPTDGCDGDFVWDPESGYLTMRDELQQFIPDASGRSPGVLLMLSGPPNHWDKSKAEHNMKQLPASRAFKAGPFDKDSIMKYEFPDWLFRDRRNSKCFSERNDMLSSLDRAGIADAYPRELSLIRLMTVQQIQAVQEVQSIMAPAGVSIRNFDTQLDQLRSVVR